MKRNRRRLTKLRAAIYNTPWAILPAKLEAIKEVIDFTGPSVSRADFPHASHPSLYQSRSISTTATNDERKIAVLNLYGTIAQRMNIMMEYSGGTSTELFGKAFDEAVSDSAVAAIVIRIDSPGGAVPGVEELSNRIFAARGTKPIVAFVDPMMCSAATWIGTAAERIVATPSALQIGSIGVIYTHYEASKREAEAGDTYTVLRSVPGKAEGSTHEELTDDYKAHLNSLISDIHTKFVAAVARNRGVTAEKVESAFGSGRTLTAQEALSAGLVDEIQTFESLIADLSASARSSSPPGARAVSPLSGPLSMNPKIKAHLVRNGLVKATGTAEEFQAALNLYFEALGMAVPAGDDAILAAMNPTPVTAPAAAVTQPQQTVSGLPATPIMSALDVMGLVATAGASLSADEKLTLQHEIMTDLQAGKLQTISQVTDRINQKAVAATQPVGANRIEFTADAQDKFMASARDAILVRTMKGERPAQIYDYRVGDYVAWKPETRNHGLSSLLGMSQQLLMTMGVPAAKVLNMSPYQIAQVVMGANPLHHGLGASFAASGGPAYNVSGMFSNILYDAANVTLRRGYDIAETTYQLWAGQGPDIKDFKPVHRVLAGEFGDPKAIPEDGEFEEVTLADGRESYRLNVWGEVFSRSWELIVSDDLGAFMDSPAKMGNAMRRKLNRLVYGVLKDNKTMGDGGALFNATATSSAGGHANRTTGSLSTYDDYRTAWSTMSRKMRAQKGVSSDSSVLNIPAKFVLYPGALKDKIETVLISSSVALASGANGNSNTRNIWEGKLTPIEEEELGAAAGGSDTRFVLAASPSTVDTVEYAHLQGMPAPVIEQQVAFDRLAIRQRIYFAFGVAALDYRGLQDHTGA